MRICSEISLHMRCHIKDVVRSQTYAFYINNVVRSQVEISQLNKWLIKWTVEDQVFQLAQGWLIQRSLLFSSPSSFL
jgi:hypothetical protein